MKEKTTIRVIKKDEQPAPEPVPSTNASGRQSRQEARDMAHTVNSWVSEFQEKRDDENSRALRELFPTG